MIVMKFGGTSVEDAASIERVAEIIRARLSLKPTIVVSAMGKTTRSLLDAAESAALGDATTAMAALEDLKSAHLNEARKLVSDATNRETFDLIETYFDELAKLLQGLVILGEVPPRGLDKILSYGELLSSAIVAGALSERGVPSRLMDSRLFIITNDRYGNASPLFDVTNVKIQEILVPAINEGRVPVLQGFIGSTRDGATTTLGFEGSDYTATIVGSALGASDIQIWKDVSGLMTTDPRLFAGARTVKVCSYREAAELTFFGAKVLHPKAIHPAARHQIPVHIYNSKRPEDTGTEIIADAPQCSNLIKSIAYTRPVTVFNIRQGVAAEGPRASTTNDFLRSILNSLNEQGIAPLVMAVSSSSVSLALEANSLNQSRERDLIEEISRFSSIEVKSRKALVTIVGEELSGNPSFAGRALKAINETALTGILHGSSPIALNIVVDESDVEEVITRLHEAFFAEMDSQVFV
jgi:aspartate kinase